MGADLEIIAIGVAIGALLVSSFTYRRNRKSEQIKIARDLTDRIEQKRHKLWLRDYAVRNSTNTKMNYDNLRDWLWHIGGTLYELEYFTHLVNEREIKGKFLIDLYSPEIRKVLDLGKRTCNEFKLKSNENTILTENQRSELFGILSKYERLIPELCETWKCEPSQTN